MPPVGTRSYWIWKSIRDRNWVCTEISSKAAALRETAAMGQGWQGLSLYKEGTVSEINLFVAELNQFTARHTNSPGDLWDPNRWGYEPRPVGPNWAIAQKWFELPWLGECYPGCTTQNAQFAFGTAHTNGGEALRKAGEKCATLLPLASYPCLFYNPRPENFIPVPQAEIIGEPTPTSWASIKNHEGQGFASCSNCGRVGHNRSGCEYPAKIHDKVGIEIEGRWRDLALMQQRATTLTSRPGNSDSSVQTDHELGFRAWEFQTSPGSLGSALTQLVELFPDSSNDSCGMHIHVSFPAIDTGLLYHPDFFTYFHERWKTWGEREHISPNHTFWTRLAGTNQYCHTNVYNPVQNLLGMDRYHQLNWRAYTEHKTLECRLLPMFRHQSLAISAAKELIDIYETYLHRPDLGDKLHKEEVILPTIKRSPWEVKQELAMPETYVHVVNHSLELRELPPVQPGMRRIAMPVGKTFSNGSQSNTDFLKTLQRKV